MVQWFLKPDTSTDASIVDDLLRSTSGGVAVVMFGCVCLTLQVAIYAFHRPAQAMALLLLVMAASSARMLGLHRARNGMAASGIVVLTGIAWASTVGLVCALCMLTGEIVLTTVAALTMTGFAFTSAYNNAGIPRLARAQVLIVSVPFLLASVFTGIPEMPVILALGPIWILGIMYLVNGIHRSVAATITTQKHNAFLAMNDDLTGLANRLSILRALEDMARGIHVHLPFGEGDMDVPGVLDKSKQLIKEMSAADVRRLIADGTITAGMIPKVETCLYALEKGVEGVVILDGRVPHAVLLELFTDQGAGTLIHR